MNSKKVDVTRLDDDVINDVACKYDQFADMPNDLQATLLLYVLSDNESRNEFEIIEDLLRLLIDINLEYLVREGVLKRVGKYKWKSDDVRYVSKSPEKGFLVKTKDGKKDERCFAWKVQ